MHGLALVVVWTAFGNPQEAAPEYATRRIQSVLKDVSEFARDVESGARSLAQAHLREGQPQGMMTEIRGLLHEHASARTVFERYIRSSGEPLMGRAIGLLAVAHPMSRQVAELMGSLFADPPDLELVKLACAGCRFSPQSPAGPGWNHTLRLLELITNSKRWRIPSDEKRSFEGSCNCTDKADFRPLLEGLLSLLRRDGIGDLKGIGLRLALDVAGRKEMTEEIRARVLGAVHRSYIKRDEGWAVAWQHLSAVMNGRPDLDALKQGFSGLDVPRQVQVLNAISRGTPDAVFTPPFNDEFDKIIEFLALPTREGGLEIGDMFNYVHAIRLRAKADPELKKRLMDHPSSTLRQRLFLKD